MNRQFVPTAARISVCAPRARDMVPERTRDAGAAGVDCLRLGPHGKTVATSGDVDRPRQQGDGVVIAPA